MSDAPVIGVLALQGDVREHLTALAAAGAAAGPVRRPEELAEVDGLVIPGGESTTISKLAILFGVMLAVLMVSVISGVDFPYLAQVTRLNAVTLAALAKAPAPPEGVKIEGAVSPDTKVSWAASSGAARYRIHWRGTTAPQWEHSKDVDGLGDTLKGVVIDDWFFGVSAISTDGYESPAVFPGPAGSFISTK